MAIGTLTAIGLAAAGGASFLSSKSKNKAASKAADTSLQTTRENNALARDIYGQNREALGPYAAAGVPATWAMNSMLGLQGDPSVGANAFKVFLDNSDYAFQQQQGGNAINSGYAGQGTLQSGAAMKDMERFRQDLQSGYRGQYMNALGNMQSLGLSGASAQAGVGQNYVNTISANNREASDAVANAALMKGNNNPLANAIGLMGGGLFGMSG